MVQILGSLGEGSHARVFKGDYLGTDVAVKVFSMTDKASINAFIGELEAYYKQPTASIPPGPNQHPSH